MFVDERLDEEVKALAARSGARRRDADHDRGSRHVPVEAARAHGLLGLQLRLDIPARVKEARRRPALCVDECGADMDQASVGVSNELQYAARTLQVEREVLRPRCVKPRRPARCTTTSTSRARAPYSPSAKPSHGLRNLQ